MRHREAADRHRRRNQLLLVGLTPSLLAALVAGVLLLTLVRNELGVLATSGGDHRTAERHFAANRWLGVVESWIAPYNEGVATLRQGEHDEALADFLTALETVPTAHECRVLHNIAVTLEVSGDAVDRRDDEAALTLYREGRAALKDRRCLERTDTSEARRAALVATDARLTEKIRELLLRQEQDFLAQLTPEQRRRLTASQADDARGQLLEQRLADKDAQNPQDPNDPKDPSDPDDPQNLSDPDDPQNPNDPRDPSNPDDPQNPNDPRDPSNPDDPQDPEGPPAQDDDGAEPPDLGW